MSIRTFNQVFLIANVVREPILKKTANGVVCFLRVVTNREWIDDDGTKHSIPQYHDLLAWNKLGEVYSQLIRVGTKVWVRGELRSSREDKKKGEIFHHDTKIDIRDLIILRGARSESDKPV